MKISVIIPTYNRVHTLPITIDSFLNQSYNHNLYEVIISDNNSTDSTEDLVKKYIRKYPDRLRYVKEPRQGVHYARNSAAKNAKGEILYFTDDDMIADKNLLKEIIKIFEFDPTVASATGRVLPKWEVTPPDWVVTLCSNLWLSLNDPPEEFVISSRDCNIFSCHQAVIREVFFKSGGFNPENVAGKWIGDGETGLNLKIKELGYKFGYNGKSIIYHIIPPQRMTQSYLNTRLKNQGSADSYTYYRKHLPSRLELWKQLGKHLVNLTRSEIKYLGNLLRGNIRWRMHHAYLFYDLNRIHYDYKLITDKSWREFVLKNDWLTDNS